MSFASESFLGLMVAVFTVYWALPRRAQNVSLVVASFVFYGWIHPWYVTLLLYSAALDFSCGLGMERWPARKGLFLWASAIGNLGLLAAFKYFDFFTDNVAALLGAVGLEVHPLTLDLLLPIGISFYTFQSLSYSVDVYRGKQAACRDPLAFLLFVSFFPQLVMGPIGRARTMLPQIAAERTLTAASFQSGLSLALWGAFKKIVIADTLGAFVHPVFAQQSPAWPMVWAAGLAASVMMFADFSGYTDIARGTARLLGFELPENFRAPYLATTPSEWWSRWHITFYGWMTEYVFNPLVLSPWCRKWLVVPFVRPTPTIHVVRGLVLTMMLAGLWHGAAWHYVAWGGFYAVIQLTYYFVGRALPPEVRNWRYQGLVLRPLLITIVVASEIMFQTGDIAKVAGFAVSNPFAATSVQWLAAGVTASMALAGAAPMVAAWALRSSVADRELDAGWAWAWSGPAWTAAAWVIFVFYRGSASDFAYFQF